MYGACARIWIAGLLLLSCKVRPTLQEASGAGAWASSASYNIDGHVATLDFGTIPRGESKTTCLALSNIGSAVITAASNSGVAPFTWAAFSDVSLQPGEEQSICVTFAPQQRGSYSTRLTASVDSAGRTTEFIAQLNGKAIDPTCHLQVNQSPLDFGAVLPHEYLTRQLIFSNEGDVSCQLEMELDGGDRFELQPRSSQPLEPGTTLQVEVTTLGADVPQLSTSDVLWRTVDPTGNASENHLELSATTAPDCFAVSPPVVDFGTHLSHCESHRELVVYNICAEPLEILQIQDLSGAVSIGNVAADVPVHRSLDMGEDGLGFVRIPLATNSATNFTGFVQLSLPWGPRFVPIRQTTTTNQRHTDHFEQKPPLIDVVISYAPHLYSANTFAQFVRFSAELLGRFDNEGADIHVGGIRGYWNVPRSPMASDAFGTWSEGELIAIGDAGYAIGHGLDAGGFIVDLFEDIPENQANQALEYANYLEMDLQALMPPASIGPNNGFRRSEAELVFIHTNVAVDASARWRPINGMWNMDDWPWELPLPTEYYLARFSQVLDEKSTMTINHLASDAGYPEDDAPVDVIHRGVGQTNGALLSLWNSSGSITADATLVKYRQFHLSGQPATDAAFNISINGVTLSESSWSYSQSSNTITLGSRPQPGSAIDISYTMTTCD